MYLFPIITQELLDQTLIETLTVIRWSWYQAANLRVRVQTLASPGQPLTPGYLKHQIFPTIVRL